MKVTDGSYKAEAPTGTALETTSGGQSIGNVTKETVFSVNFNLHEKATVNLVALMAKPEADYALDGNVAFNLDDKEVTPAAVTFGSVEGNTYWNWKEVTISNTLLAAGMHHLTLTATNAFPNMDCIKIITNGYGSDFFVKGAETVRIEGENVDKTNLISDGGSSFTETSDEAIAETSGHSLLCHCNPGSYFEISFENTIAINLSLSLRLSKYEALVIGENYSVYVDGNKVEWTDPTLVLGKADETHTNDWHNWKICDATSKALEAGRHTMKFSFEKAGCNVDYVDFVFLAPVAE